MYTLTITKDKRPNRCKISTDPKFFTKLREEFSMPNPALRSGNRSFFAQERLYVITPVGGMMTGLVPDVVKVAKSLCNSITVDISQEVKDELLTGYVVDDDYQLVMPQNKKFSYREYQEDAIRLGIKYGRGSFVFATSAGKSLIIYGLFLNLKEFIPGMKALIIVPNLQLVTQFRDDIKDYGYTGKIGIFSGKISGDDPEESDICIVNIQYMNEKNLAKIFSYTYELVFIDEAQTAKADSQLSVNLSKVTGIKHRFGLTGTLPSKSIDIWTVIGQSGRVLRTIKAAELQEQGFIAKTNIRSVKLVHGINKPPVPEEYQHITDNYELIKRAFTFECMYIAKCEKSNLALAKLAMSRTGNTIVLFDYTAHGKAVTEMAEKINKHNKQIFYIDGNVDVEDRDDIKVILERDSNCVVFAQCKCFSTGISVKNIANIMFAFSAGKEAVKIIQSIGRGLRLVGDKVDVDIWDCYHSFKYSTSHFGNRQELYFENYGKYGEIQEELQINL